MKLDEHQIRILNASDPRIFVASPAGSGKTRLFIEKVTNESEVLALTFSNSAAEEIKKRNPQIHTHTFHSLCFQIIQEAGIKFRVMDESKDNKVIQQTVENCKIDMSTDVFKSFILKNFTGSTDNENFKVINQAVEIYIRSMEESGNYSFTFLLKKALDLLKTNEELKTFFSRKAMIAVDEFQDIDTLQLQILETIATKKLFCVMDLHQSIYGWRGVDIKSLVTFTKTGNTMTMPNSYRVPDNILKRAYKIVKEKEFNGTKVNGLFETLQFENNEKEFEFIAEKLNELNYSKRAVLCRSNWLVDFTKAKLQIYDKNLMPPLEWIISTEFNLLFDYYKLIFADKLSLKKDDINATTLEVISNYKGIGEKTINLIRRMSDKSDNSHLNTIFEINRHQIREFCTFLKWLRENTPFPLRQSMKFIAKELKLDKNEFVKEADRFLKEMEIEYAQLQLLVNEDQRNEKSGFYKKTGELTIQTIHQSKGQEFDYVFIPCFIDSIYPPVNCKNLEEEKRILLVALTRARKGVFITSSRVQKWRGYITPGIPSLLIK